MKKIILGIVFLLLPFIGRSDEGMWLPMLVNRLNAEDMAKQGCRLTPEEIYNVNQSSLKDAIVSLGFCTGELISESGLMLTNHHCAFSAIQTHSSVEKNYIKDGFWAKQFSDELHVPGLTASILVRMDDVTAAVLKEVKDNMSYEERNKAIAAAIKNIQDEASEKKKYKALVKDMFQGNEYYLFVYEVFNDVRLVGAPPSSIGKFGGDTDNWMWPRHTGDFALFRVYASQEGKPAAFSPSNVPYKPRHYLPISLSGYKEGDFAMIYGFPGRTNRYIVSPLLKLNVEKINPAYVKISGKKLETWKKDMDADDKARIQLAAKYARTANSWKYYIGQTEGIKRLKTLDQVSKEENEFQTWANRDPGTKAKYGQILDNLKTAYASYENAAIPSTYLNMAAMGAEAMNAAAYFNPLVKALKSSPEKTAAIDSIVRDIKAKTDKFFKDYNVLADKHVFYELLMLYVQDVPAGKHAPAVADVLKRKGKTTDQKVARYTEEVFRKSILVSPEKVNAFLAKPELKTIEKDPVFEYYQRLTAHAQELNAPIQQLNSVIDTERRKYMEALRSYKADKKFYPDANSTLRLTYGTVKSYSPKDAIQYHYKTTIDGLAAKYIPSDEEFDVPKKLLDLYKVKDYGPYAENGTVPVAFLTTTDITGGNSGSPVMNAKGELIGVAFDGNWEAMTGDLVFDPEYKRTIAVDIRYVLFVMDKVAGASHLLKELKLISNNTISQEQVPGRAGE